MNFFKKYLKYKEKYLILKNQLGGMPGAKRGRNEEGGRDEERERDEERRRREKEYYKKMKEQEEAQKKEETERIRIKEETERRREEEEVTNCYLIIENENGFSFKGVNGKNATSTDRETDINLFKEDLSQKTIKEVVEEVKDRLKNNSWRGEKQVTFTEDQLEKFNIKSIDEEKMMKSFDDWIVKKFKGVPNRVMSIRKIGERIETRTKIEREAFMIKMIFPLYPTEGYHYVLDKGTKFKIIKTPPPHLRYTFLGGSRERKADGTWAESTDDCLKREVEEEGNFKIDVLCTNWTQPKISLPNYPVPYTLYILPPSKRTSDTAEHIRYHKLYYIKIKSDVENDLLKAYQNITEEKATEFFNGAFVNQYGLTQEEDRRRR
jgi:hypothetical protein